MWHGVEQEPGAGEGVAAGIGGGGELPAHAIHGERDVGGAVGVVNARQIAGGVVGIGRDQAACAVGARPRAGNEAAAGLPSPNIRSFIIKHQGPLMI